MRRQMNKATKMPIMRSNDRHVAKDQKNPAPGGRKVTKKKKTRKGPGLGDQPSAMGPDGKGKGNVKQEW